MICLCTLDLSLVVFIYEILHEQCDVFSLILLDKNSFKSPLINFTVSQLLFTLNIQWETEGYRKGFIRQSVLGMKNISDCCLSKILPVTLKWELEFNINKLFSLLSCWRASILCKAYYLFDANLQTSLTFWRSSHQRCSIKKQTVLKNFAIFTGKHLCYSLVLISCQFEGLVFSQALFLLILRHF